MSRSRYIKVIILVSCGLFVSVGCGADDEASTMGSGGVEAGEVTGGELEADLGGESPLDGGSSDVEEPPHPRYAEQMLRLVNALRAEGVRCGGELMSPVGPLRLNHELDEAALLHAQDMAERGYFEHVSLDGREPWDRMNDAGYFGRAYGENIAAGQPGAGATFDQWVNSPGHCRNMMSPDFSELGVGYHAQMNTQYIHYWVQNFGRP